jgi:hypothetical protein
MHAVSVATSLLLPGLPLSRHWSADIAFTCFLLLTLTLAHHWLLNSVFVKNSKFSITSRISRLVSRAEVRGCVWGLGNGGS